MAKNKNKVALEFELSEQDTKTLEEVAGKGNLTTFLKEWIEKALAVYANGGLTLEGNDLSQISKACGKSISTSEELIKAVEGANKLNKGQRVFQFVLDPALLESFSGYAEFNGTSLDVFMQDCWGQILANGWLYQMAPDVVWLALSRQLADEVKAASKDEVVTSDSIKKVLKKVA